MGVLTAYILWHAVTRMNLILVCVYVHVCMIVHVHVYCIMILLYYYYTEISDSHIRIEQILRNCFVDLAPCWYWSNHHWVRYLWTHKD